MTPPDRADARALPAVPGFTPGTRALPKVANVSWPRSGHGLLQRLLRGLLGDGFGYCEFYQPRRAEGSPCCGAFPCRRPDIHMTKQHDVDGDAELAPDARLIVQYRAFLPAVVSHFEMSLEANPALDTAEGFRAFALPRADRYRRFVEKWVLAPRTGRLLLPYEALTGEPAAALARVVRHFDAPDALPRIETVVARAARITYVDGQRVTAAGHGVREARDVTAFRFHDAALFDELAARAAPDGTAGAGAAAPAV